MTEEEIVDKLEDIVDQLIFNMISPIIEKK